MRNNKSSFSYRGFVSILLALCFLGLAVSGVVIYFAPPCSIAAATGWTVSGLTKVQWSSLHLVMALIIIFLSPIHLFIYNWKTFVNYFRRRNFKQIVRSEQNISFSEKLKVPKEVFAAVLAAIILYAGALSLITPFDWLYIRQDAIKDSYRESVERPGRGLSQASEMQLNSGRELQFDTLSTNYLNPAVDTSQHPDTLKQTKMHERQYQQGRGLQRGVE